MRRINVSLWCQVIPAQYCICEILLLKWMIFQSLTTWGRCQIWPFQLRMWRRHGMQQKQVKWPHLVSSWIINPLLSMLLMMGGHYCIGHCTMVAWHAWSSYWIRVLIQTSAKVGPTLLCITSSTMWVSTRVVEQTALLLHIKQTPLEYASEDGDVPKEVIEVLDKQLIK